MTKAAEYLIAACVALCVVAYLQPMLAEALSGLGRVAGVL